MVPGEWNCWNISGVGCRGLDQLFHTPGGLLPWLTADGTFQGVCASVEEENNSCCPELQALSYTQW